MNDDGAQDPAVDLRVTASGVAWLRLDRPANRNALTEEMLSGLLDAIGRVRADDGARCLVLTSSRPGVLSSGGDLNGFRADRPLVHKHLANAGYVQLVRELTDLPKPTVCAANGHVLAGALGVALACDVVIAAESATFGTPEILVGAFPFMVAALLHRNVGRKKANELLLMGRRLPAAEAERIGLVNHVAPDGELEEVATAWAGELASRSPLLMRLGKEAVRRQYDMPFDDALEFLRGQLTIALATDDIQEGVAAFFERRDPVWTGS